MDQSKILKILRENSDKNFVQRIIFPSAYPTLPLGNGMHATHRMEWGEANGKYFVYPRVVQQSFGLQDLGDNAFDYAMKSGEAIPFDNAESAEAFSKQYKTIWDLP